MNLIYLNAPGSLPWQTNLLDLLMLVIVISAIAYAVVQFRAGKRIYAVVLLAALIYGQVLELAGMATLNMYLQGQFVVMLNYPAIPLFAGTTAMPFYVTIFYPVWFFLGFKVIEALGIKKAWQSAVTGGLFAISIDAPYIIEGNLRHIVWWTWDPNFKMFQYFAGWPLADMCWQAVFGMVFYFLIFHFRPRIDGSAEAKWSNAKAFGVFAPLVAPIVIVVGTILLAPLTITTLLGGAQWPVASMLVVAMISVAVVALRSAEPAFTRIEPITAWVVGIYVVSFAAMIIANVVREGGLTLYIAVQILGLLAALAFVTFPMYAPRRSASAATSGRDHGLAAAER